MSQISTPPPIPETTSPRSKRGGGLSVFAIVLVLIALGAGAWIVWSAWGAYLVSGHGTAVALDEKPSQIPGGFRAEQMRYHRIERQEEMAAQQEAELNGPDYVQPFTNKNGQIVVTGVDVKGGRTKLTVRRIGQQSRVNASSIDPNFLPADVRSLLNLRADLQGDFNNSLSQRLGITAEQRAKVLLIPGGAWYTIDAPTRKKAEDAFTAWSTASPAERPAKEKDLIAIARELDSVQATKVVKSATDRANQIKAIVSPDQLRMYAQFAGR
jgi:hypothetical protein